MYSSGLIPTVLAIHRHILSSYFSRKKKNIFAKYKGENVRKFFSLLHAQFPWVPVVTACTVALYSNYSLTSLEPSMDGSNA
jgi:hypothetical protein